MRPDQIAAEAVFVEHRLGLEVGRNRLQGGDRRGRPVDALDRRHQTQAADRQSGGEAHGQRDARRAPPVLSRSCGAGRLGDGPCEQHRRDDSKQQFVARMLERHGDEADEGRRADQRHRDPPRQRKTEKQQQRDLHRPDMAEILRLPFADARQVVDAHQAEGKQQRLDSIRIDERRRQRSKAEQRPIPQCCEARYARRRVERLECERSDQRQAEDETAMHVRPGDH